MTAMCEEDADASWIQAAPSDATTGRGEVLGAGCVGAAFSNYFVYTTMVEALAKVRRETLDNREDDGGARQLGAGPNEVRCAAVTLAHALGK